MCLSRIPGTSLPATVVLTALGCAKIRMQAADTIPARGAALPDSEKAAAMQTLTGFVH